MSELRRTPFYRVLYRGTELLGCEREPLIILGMICAAVLVSGLNIVAMTVAVGIWRAVFPLMRMVASYDPLASRIYVRSVKRYRQHVYPPRSRPYRNT
jgi:type IV secretion system protein VirB3